MKFIIALTFLVFSYLSPNQAIPFTEIEKAVVAADANTIVANGAEKILVSINNKESIYSKSQATMVLRDFFAKNKPVSFKISAKSNTSGAVSFIAGDCASKGGKFRISFQFKRIGDHYKIDRIAISELYIRQIKK